MYFSENKYINPVYSRSAISHTLIQFLKKIPVLAPQKNQTSIGVKYLSKSPKTSTGCTRPGAYLFFLR